MCRPCHAKPKSQRPPCRCATNLRQVRPTLVQMLPKSPGYATSLAKFGRGPSVSARFSALRPELAQLWPKMAEIRPISTDVVFKCGPEFAFARQAHRRTHAAQSALSESCATTLCATRAAQATSYPANCRSTSSCWLMPVMASLSFSSARLAGQIGPNRTGRTRARLRQLGPELVQEW